MNGCTIAVFYSVFPLLLSYNPVHANALDQLPDDVDALKSLFAAQATKLDEVTARNEQLATENHRYQAQVLTLTEQLNLALARRYAASSEKLSPDQIRLFDEAERRATACPAEDEMM